MGDVYDLLSVENLQIDIAIRGGRLNVVKGVSFSIPRGKTVALVGESGSGKSIVSQAIMGILPPVASISGGAIKFFDPQTPDTVVDIARLPRDSKEMRQLRGGRISIIFQEPMTSLSPVHTIGNQVSEALLLHRNVNATDARQTTEQMLQLVGFPSPARAFDSYPMELSGGLRQRAMIAMALICHPTLLIADEPTTALDVTVQAQVLAVLKDLQAKLDMSLLLITHDLGVVANMADEVVVVYHGKVMEAGPTRDIFENPQHAYLKALLAAVPTLSMGPDDKLVALREINEELPASIKPKTRQNENPDEPLLALRNVSKVYSTRKGGADVQIKAVNDVSFDVRPGECFGLVGESGCGKTSLSKMITRAITPTSGSILFDNHDGVRLELSHLKDRALKAFRPHLQMVFQDPFSSLSPRSTIVNTLMEPLEIHQIGDPKSRRQRAEELLQMVGLPKSALNRYPHSFSGGQRQRIGIARALALEPDLMICDEPVSALDVSVQAQILNLLNKLRAELGLTTIFISHNLAVVNYVADRIAVMRRGRIVEIAPRGRLFTDPVHPYTKRLLAAIPTIELDQPLDLSLTNNLSEDEEAGWDPIFVPDHDDEALELVEVQAGHLVLVRANQKQELVA